jgi:hypothetical protein
LKRRLYKRLKIRFDGKDVLICELNGGGGVKVFGCPLPDLLLFVWYLGFVPASRQYFLLVLGHPHFSPAMPDYKQSTGGSEKRQLSCQANPSLGFRCLIEKMFSGYLGIILRPQG